jgi:putative ABC transport system permease protein
VFRNYLKIALRNFSRHKGYSTINIAGLAVGMACCIFILAFIVNELSYDRFHEKSGRICRVTTEATIAGDNIKVPTIPAPMGPQLVADFPEVETAVRFRKYYTSSFQYGDRKYSEKNLIYVDDSFFRIFSFELKRGNPESVLSEPYTVVVTEDAARRYFGDEDPIGKTIKYLDAEEEYTVTGIAADPPANSHFRFDLLASFESLYRRDPGNLGWYNFNHQTYLLLREGADYRELEAKLDGFGDKYLAEFKRMIGGEMHNYLQPLTSIHLHSKMANELEANGDIRNIHVFAAIGLFILILACINFMNLSTARSAGRAREVGVRKVLGAGKERLIHQFLGESLLMASISAVAALILAALLMPYFNNLTGLSMGIGFLFEPRLVAGLFALVLFVGLIAGSYPAAYLSKFDPAPILKGDLTRGRGGAGLRRGLVVFQFAISTALIIGTGIIMDQLRFMRSMDLGFEKGQVIVFPVADRGMRENLSALREELGSVKGVRSASVSMTVPGEEKSNLTLFHPEGWATDKTVALHNFTVDEHFLGTFGIDLVAGRNFSRGFSADQEEAVIINEAAAKHMKWDNPVGKRLYVGSDDDLSSYDEAYTVVGVVGDFHNRSLHHTVEPLLLRFSPEFAGRVSLKIEAAGIPATLERLEKKWDEAASDRPFNYFFMDDHFDSLYRAEERLGSIVRVFSIFAVFIGCLGLFGLVSFAAERRTKEMGIRKVLGSPARSIVILLCREFAALVLVANAVAWPAAYLVMRRWLEVFPYRAEVSILTFVAAGTAAMAVALLTVSWRAVRAAQTDPVKALKYE